MVIIFSKEKKKNLYILATAIVLIVGLIIFWVFFLNKEEPVPGVIEVTSIEAREQRISIDFGLLESEIIKQLKPFEFIESTSTERFGRENPFAPYLEIAPDLDIIPSP
ncbi:hypothetical protein KKC63_01585 [Patescibacteria group bacterium]|nr:hypothetical protein [Patescibacteria group bacterium]MBU4022828.1 hypothetical protein [Patescibacteria group bacterium]MBU4078435.1 hypothetical protein [Patescibacteria group bacterium]